MDKQNFTIVFSILKPFNKQKLYSWMGIFFIRPEVDNLISFGIAYPLDSDLSISLPFLHIWTGERLATRDSILDLRLIGIVDSI